MHTCMRGGDFESTVKFLAETPVLGAGNYFVVAGAKPGEGAVITRNATGEKEKLVCVSNRAGTQGHAAFAKGYCER